ncbi:MAG: hypothetical protein GDYSWBUE_000706 [Candidatus Fervidibacterota bacterium]
MSFEGQVRLTQEVLSKRIVEPIELQSEFASLRICGRTGAYEVVDKRSGVRWFSNPYVARFGEATFAIGGTDKRVELNKFASRLISANAIELRYLPSDGEPSVVIRLELKGEELEVSYEADGTQVRSVRLLDSSFFVGDADDGYIIVPVRLGMLIPGKSGISFEHAFTTFSYEGCHMEMFGVVKDASAMLVTWHSPYVTLRLRSIIGDTKLEPYGQLLLPTLELSGDARRFSIRLLGKGDYVNIAKAYRTVAKSKGWLVTWDEKLRENPERSKLFGASNFKLWTCLARRMDEESKQEEWVRVNWTFEQAAQIAEHLKNDMGMERVLFILGGWIHRGYDNQHPDILPAAPECGGNEGLAECSRRVKGLGYLFCLHDNYQDMYRDAPSWDERYIMKARDGSLVKGGRWLGGRAYITCSRKAIELAKRPQNLPAVKELFAPNAYFIDTTFAAGLYECYDPEHRLTRSDDMFWKQELCRYARGLFGIFGSECGREWGIPVADFFEGLSGVSGTYYHDANLLKKLGATVVPIFEMVYRDCIQVYGKYGYDIFNAAEYVLHHILIGRPLNYHSVPSGLYWREGWRELMVEAQPSVIGVERIDERQFRISYRWLVRKPVSEDWRVFVHFTDASGNIKFQNDHDPAPPTSKWQPPKVTIGPLTVRIPEGLIGTFDVRMGLYRPPQGERARLIGIDDGQRRYIIGRVHIKADGVEFEPLTPTDETVMDTAVFARADNGWAEGMHPLDRFMKNTHEVLSPLNEITARMLMSAYRFLTPDLKVRQSTFGDGRVSVVVNLGSKNYKLESKRFGEIVLPPYGFIADAPTFVAFHAASFNGLNYADAPLFTIRSLDGKPLEHSTAVRIYHGFGDARLMWRGKVIEVKRERFIKMQ